MAPGSFPALGGDREGHRRQRREKTRDLLIEEVRRGSDPRLPRGRNRGDDDLLTSLPAQRYMRFGFLLGKRRIDARLPGKEFLRRLQNLGGTVDGRGFLERALPL